jgi:hypothetical protein
MSLNATLVHSCDFIKKSLLVEGLKYIYLKSYSLKKKKKKNNSIKMIERLDMRRGNEYLWAWMNNRKVYKGKNKDRTWVLLSVLL